jgi:HAD superfamily hydrolase (TIGR01549 family)
MTDTNNIKHIWFDFAGTLYRETPDFTKAHDDFRFQVYADLEGIKDSERAKTEYLELYKQHGSNSAVFRALGKPSDYWMNALDDFDFTALLQPDPAVPETLIKLKDTVPLSLFTNFVPRRITMLLEYLRISADCFSHVLSGDDIPERKPALVGFYKMVELTGVPTNQIMYIGDRVDVDIKPAKQVGMRAGLIYGEAAEADCCFAEFKDILELKGSLSS